MLHKNAVSFTAAADGAAGFEYRLDQGAWTRGGSTHKLAGLEPGDHSVSVRAVLADGKADPNPVHRHFRIAGHIAQVKPSGFTTGVPRGTSLRVHDGDMVIDKDGTVIDAMDIRGIVKIRAKNVTIKRSIIRGHDAKNITGLVMNYEASAKNTRVEDSTLAPDFPSAYLEGVKGMNIHAKRLEISGVVDGAGFHGNDNTLYDSWVHDLRHYASGDYPGAQVPTHNDGIQIHGGSNGKFRGNFISGGDNAAIMMTQDAGKTSNMDISNNWLDDGGCAVNIDHKGKGAMSAVVLKDNKFGRGMRVKNCAIIIKKNAGVKVEGGNVWMDNDKAVDVRNGG